MKKLFTAHVLVERKKRAYAASQDTTICTALHLLGNRRMICDSSPPKEFQVFSFPSSCFSVPAYLNLTPCHHDAKHRSGHQWGWVGSFHPSHIFCSKTKTLYPCYIHRHHPAPSVGAAGCSLGRGMLQRVAAATLWVNFSLVE